MAEQLEAGEVEERRVALVEAEAEGQYDLEGSSGIW